MKKFRHYSVYASNYLWEFDLAFMPKDPETKKIGFLLVVDCYNLMTFTRAITSKHSAKIRDLFLDIVKKDNNNIFPVSAQSDAGNEFSLLKDVFKKQQIYYRVKKGRSKAAKVINIRRVYFLS